MKQEEREKYYKELIIRHGIGFPSSTSDRIEKILDEAMDFQHKETLRMVREAMMFDFDRMEAKDLELPEDKWRQYKFIRNNISFILDRLEGRE